MNDGLGTRAELAVKGKSRSSILSMMGQESQINLVISKMITQLHGSVTHYDLALVTSTEAMYQWKQRVINVWQIQADAATPDVPPSNATTAPTAPSNASTPTAQPSDTSPLYDPWANGSPYRATSIGTDAEVGDLIAETMTAEANRATYGMSRQEMRDLSRDPAAFGPVLEAVRRVLITKLTGDQYRNMTTSKSVREWTAFITEVWYQPSANFGRPSPPNTGVPANTTAPAFPPFVEQESAASDAALDTMLDTAIKWKSLAFIRDMTSDQINAILSDTAKTNQVVFDGLKVIQTHTPPTQFDRLYHDTSLITSQKSEDVRSVWRGERDRRVDMKTPSGNTSDQGSVVIDFPEITNLVPGASTGNTTGGVGTPLSPEPTIPPPPSPTASPVPVPDPDSSQTNMSDAEVRVRFVRSVGTATRSAVSAKNASEIAELLASESADDEATAVVNIAKTQAIQEGVSTQQIATIIDSVMSHWIKQVLDTWELIRTMRLPDETNSTGSGAGTGTGNTTGSGSEEEKENPQKPDFHFETGTETGQKTPGTGAMPGENWMVDDPVGYFKNLYKTYSEGANKNMYQDDMVTRAEHEANKKSALRPFLPIAGTDAFDNQDDQESDKLKAQNLMMGMSKPPNWPLSNIDNPFWLQNMALQGLRYSGQLFDMPPVMNGGTLAEAKLYGSYRSIPVAIPPPAREAGNRKYRRLY
jgi:hypothetical protein